MANSYSPFFIMEEKTYKLISFLDQKSLANFNKIAKKFGITYKLTLKKKPVEEKINYKKLMEEAPGFSKGDK